MSLANYRLELPTPSDLVLRSFATRAESQSDEAYPAPGTLGRWLVEVPVSSR